MHSTHKKKTSIKKEGGETGLSATYMAAKVGALRAALRWWWEGQKEEELGASRGFPVVTTSQDPCAACMFPALDYVKAPSLVSVSPFWLSGLARGFQTTCC